MGFTWNGPPRAGMLSLPEHAFDQLEQFILSNREEDSGTQPLELMSLSAKPGLGKVITAKNYVGVITTKGGLPTTAGAVPGVFTGEELYRFFRRAGGAGASFSHRARV